MNISGTLTRPLRLRGVTSGAFTCVPRPSKGLSMGSGLETLAQPIRRDDLLALRALDSSTLAG